MGFHLVASVYANVTGTSPAAQAVLTYLAFKEDDLKGGRCRPTVDQIVAATHFSRSTVRNTLDDLNAAKLVDWKHGGRLKGNGGSAIANLYTLHVPRNPPKALGRQMAQAEADSRPKHRPTDGPSIGQPSAPISQAQPALQPSVIGTPPEPTEVDAFDRALATPVLKKAYEDKADAWLKEDWDGKSRRFKADPAFRDKTRHELAKEAMNAAGVSDRENYRIFSSTIIRRDPDMVYEVICRFASERRQHEHDKLRNPAAALNSLLSDLPTVN